MGLWLGVPGLAMSALAMPALAMRLRDELAMAGLAMARFARDAGLSWWRAAA